MLGRITCPALVIHGKADPLVPYEGGVDTAYRIRDSRLVLLDGFGHDLPPQLHDRFADMIAAHAREAGGLAVASRPSSGVVGNPAALG